MACTWFARALTPRRARARGSACGSYAITALLLRFSSALLLPPGSARCTHTTVPPRLVSGSCLRLRSACRRALPHALVYFILRAPFLRFASLCHPAARAPYGSLPRRARACLRAARRCLPLRTWTRLLRLTLPRSVRPSRRCASAQNFPAGSDFYHYNAYARRYRRFCRCRARCCVVPRTHTRACAVPTCLSVLRRCAPSARGSAAACRLPLPGSTCHNAL